MSVVSKPSKKGLGDVPLLFDFLYVYRRDKIWFVAKGRGQNTKLNSLVEIKSDYGVPTCKNAKYDKQYLEGKYGAAPYL